MPIHPIQSIPLSASLTGLPDDGRGVGRRPPPHPLHLQIPHCWQLKQVKLLDRDVRNIDWGQIFFQLRARILKRVRILTLDTPPHPLHLYSY